MSKKQTIDAKTQSAKDNLKEALNSKSGFKDVMSSGTVGAGASLNNHSK